MSQPAHRHTGAIALIRRKTRSLRVVFFGSSHFSCLVLEQLLSSEHEVVAVVTQPDQPAGRKLELCPTAICSHIGSSGLPLLKPAYLRNNFELRRTLRELKPDAYIVASYGQIIPPKILELVKWPLNVHPSLLPSLRGASPVRTALLQGITETGCCIICMTQRMDDGDIVISKQQQIDDDWNYAALESRLGRLGGELALSALTMVEQDQVRLRPQDNAKATYTRIYGREDTWIDWNLPARNVSSFIRAWDPDIGALTLLPDGKRLKIWKVRLKQMPDLDPAAPGSVVSMTHSTVVLACGSTAGSATKEPQYVQLLEVQPENKRRMEIAAFLAGNKLAVGEQFRPKPAVDQHPIPLA